MMPEGQQSQSQPVKDVDHSRHARVFTECHDTLAHVVHHPFIVYQTDIL